MVYSDKFESDNKKKSRNVGLSTTGASYNIVSDNMTKNERLMNGIANWASFYRENPHIFVEEFLGIKLKPFQKIILFAMFHYNNSMFLASRGLSKTFLTAIFCVTRAILYPGSKIIVASGVKSQAMKIVSEKIPELMNLSKTGMIQREIKGSIKTGMNGDDPNVSFHNGSWIKVVPSSHNARSARANILILDEFRMIKPEIYTSVLRRFLTVARQPGFLAKKEYATQEYQERNKEVFLTSCYYKYNWAYPRYKVFLNSMLNGKGYFVCGLPYQIGIKENLSNKAQLMEEINEDDFDETLFRMEMNALWEGESTKAYYKYEEVAKCRTIQKPIIPITDEQYASLKGNNSKLQFFRQKQPNEIRILAVDVALIGGKKNDASQMMLLSMMPQGSDGYVKMVEYMESADGGNTELQAFRVKQLFYDLNCDFCVLDTMGNGIGLYDSMTKSTIDEVRDRIYPAWCSMNDETKDMTRSIDKDAIPIIYTVTTAGQNAGAILHEMYTYTKVQFERRKLRLMSSELEGKEFLIENHDFLKKDSYEQATMIAPYMQASRLITELTQLESEVRGGFIKLVEPAGKRKDRAMCLFYGMYYIKILEADLKKRAQKNSYEDLYNGATNGPRKKVHPFMGGAGNPFANGRSNPFDKRR